MRLPKFEYLEPKTLKEATRTRASDAKRSVLLAGGTDLLVNMKHRRIQLTHVINLKMIPQSAYVMIGCPVSELRLLEAQLKSGALP
jgi:CO/xanthine dehydrogenase FAD-binding subunit